MILWSKFFGFFVLNFGRDVLLIFFFISMCFFLYIFYLIITEIKMREC